MALHIHSLIQHFNPACRAARAFPWLPSSRILIALSDHDLPIAHRLVSAVNRAERPTYDIINALEVIQIDDN